MNILLINPEIRVDRPAYNFPLGLGYMAAVLLQKGHSVQVIDRDAIKYSEAEFKKELAKFLDQIDMVGIGGLITTYKTQSSIVKTIRSMGYTDKIVLGGGLATTEYEILLENLDVDFCVRGEGEKTICDLTRHLENGLMPEKVKGIVYRKSNNNIVVNPHQDIIKELDTIPFPAWDLFPVNKYLRTHYHSYLTGDLKDTIEMVMFTSRGCPYKCNFCYHINGYHYRARSADNIIEEIQLLKSKYGKKLHIRFLDDCFVIDRKRLIEFCDKAIKEKLKITWSCMGRANICTKRILKLMKQAGCIYIGYGLESGNDDILQKVIHKRSTVKENIKTVRDTLNLGITSSPTVMTNQPGEGAETINDTVNMIRKIGRSNTVLFYACPYPETPLWKYARKNNLIKMSRKVFLEKISDQDVNQLIVNLTDLSDEELIKLHDDAEEEIRKINKKIGIIKIYRLLRAKRRWGILKRLLHL